MITGNDLKDFTEVSTRYLPSAMMPFSAFSFTEPDNTRIVRTIKTGECSDNYEPETKTGVAGDSFELNEPTPKDDGKEFKGWTSPLVESADKSGLLIPAGLPVCPVCRVTELEPVFVKKSKDIHDKFILRIPIYDRVHVITDHQLPDNQPTVFTLLDVSDLVASYVPPGVDCKVEIVTYMIFYGYDGAAPDFRYARSYGELNPNDFICTSFDAEFYEDGNEDSPLVTYHRKNRASGASNSWQDLDPNSFYLHARSELSGSRVVNVRFLTHGVWGANPMKIVKFIFGAEELVISERD